jgi:hypothetical protein
MITASKLVAVSDHHVILRSGDTVFFMRETHWGSRCIAEATWEDDTRDDPSLTRQVRIRIVTISEQGELSDYADGQNAEVDLSEVYR